MTQESTDTELEKLNNAILALEERLDKKLDTIEQKVTQIDTEVKAWGNWLRTASGAIIFVVSISFLGAFVGLLLPIAFDLWRNIK